LISLSALLLKRLFRLFLILLIFANLFLFFQFSENSVKASSNFDEDSFSIIQISDTQYLSALYPDLFTNLTTWISQNSQYYNIKMVVHTGDIVDDNSQSYQWVNANESMSILLNSGIPYSWCAGNHDQLNHNVNTSWNGSKYLAFNGSFSKLNSFWVEDMYDSKNTAVKLAIGNFPFVIINIEYHANSSVLIWVRSLLNKASGSNVILATHSYLNNSQGYGYGGDYKWEDSLRTLLNEHPNVFLTISGHDNLGNSANMTRVGNREEIFFNRQGMENWKGSASARIYTFNIASMEVSVKTYVTYTQSFLTDGFNQFSFNVTLQSDNANNIFPYSYFWICPSYQSRISFSNRVYAPQNNQIGSAWSFTNLSMDGANSNLTATTNGANMVINNYNPNNWVNYTVTGNGTQTISSLINLPTEVYIDGVQDSNLWSYSNGSITVMGALSSVAINFAQPTSTPFSPNSSLPSATPSLPSVTFPANSTTPLPTPFPDLTPTKTLNPSPAPTQATISTTQPIIHPSPSSLISPSNNPNTPTKISVSDLIVGAVIAFLGAAIILGLYLKFRKRNSPKEPAVITQR
jgi:hypothetical protein